MYVKVRDLLLFPIPTKPLQLRALFDDSIRPLHLSALIDCTEACKGLFTLISNLFSEVCVREKERNIKKTRLQIKGANQIKSHNKFSYTRVRNKTLYFGEFIKSYISRMLNIIQFP